MPGAGLGLKIGESRVQTSATPGFCFHKESRLVLPNDFEFINFLGDQFEDCRKLVRTILRHTRFSSRQRRGDLALVVLAGFVVFAPER